MPTKAELSKFAIRGRVTESAAATFTEAQVNTNLSIEGDHLFIVTGLWLAHNGELDANDEQVQIQLCYASQSALIGPSNPDWIVGMNQFMTRATSGTQVYERQRYESVDYFPIAEPQLFLGVAGTGTASAITAEMKMEGYLAKVSTSEYFRITRLR